MNKYIDIIKQFNFLMSGFKEYNPHINSFDNDKLYYEMRKDKRKKLNSEIINIRNYQMGYMAEETEKMKKKEFTTNKPEQIYDFNLRVNYHSVFINEKNHKYKNDYLHKRFKLLCSKLLYCS